MPLKIRLPYLVQDPRSIALKEIDSPIEMIPFERETFCLSGPVARRVAVVDFDDASGALAPGLKFLAPTKDREFGTYELANNTDFAAPDFLILNAFTLVLGTLYMYEEEDALGREVEWAFGSPQLLVVPRAGEWANAFYHRESHSLQFFYFPSARDISGNTRVFTALSQDVIAHETGHAILDGIAPDLYNCLTPQSLALHEAVADLSALLVALRSRKVCDVLLRQTEGSVSGSNAFSRLAEQFGFERDPSARAGQLRDMWNDKTLDPDDTSVDAATGAPNRVSRSEPHLLSEVLSGALFRVFAHLHEEYKAHRVVEKNVTPFSASGSALFAAREHLKRLVLRSLDYLPPGEVSFTDYGRAILASDRASYEKDSEGRNKLVEEFQRRHIVGDASELDILCNFEHASVARLDLETLVASDWAAYEFADREREFFGIPDAVNFRVRPRRRAKKTYWTAEGPKPVTECIFKVSWDRLEENPRGLPLPALRQITVGTTLVIDWESRRIRVLIKSQAAVAKDANALEKKAADTQRYDRDDLLRKMVERRSLGIGEEGDQEPHFGWEARIEMSGDLMRVRGAGRMLHLATTDHDDSGHRHG